MGLKLTILSWWTPSWIIGKELNHVSKVTTIALKSLLATYSPNYQVQTVEQNAKRSKTIDSERTLMAAEHTMLVQTLVAAVGEEKAIEIGRDCLFEVGKRLGIDTRNKLGIDNNPKNLIKAAKILYRVLGIDFRVEWYKENQATLVVDRCELAKRYSEITCMILSATDEGVVSGINPRSCMKFNEVMTSGCPKCRAHIEFTGEMRNT